MPEKIATLHAGNYWTSLPNANPPGKFLSDVFTAEQVRQAQRDAALAGRSALLDSSNAFVAMANWLRARRDAEIADLRKIGGQMANVMFNLAQRPGDPLAGDIVATMDNLRNQWDAAVRANPPDRQDQQPARESIDTVEFLELLGAFRSAHVLSIEDPVNALIAHINAWGGVAEKT